VDGVLNVNKSAGMTSHDVVARVRKALQIKKVGHAGTLDPMATGVLLILLGHATRIASLLMEGEKSYRATCVFGVSTTTQDSTGEVISDKDASSLTPKDVQSVMPGFRGDILQMPPMVSAVHHEGKRLYELARKGQEVERQPRPVKVYSLELLDFQPGKRAEAELDITCSRGTYVRTLCSDIGDALGVGGMMSGLTRTRVGTFTIEDSFPLEQVLAGEIEPVSIDDALPDLPALDLDESETRAVLHGNRIATRADFGDSLVKMRDPSGRIIALAKPVHRDSAHWLQPDMVFSGS
jgi:tRNA pseudouridine55 synthase